MDRGQEPLEPEDAIEARSGRLMTLLEQLGPSEDTASVPALSPAQIEQRIDRFLNLGIAAYASNTMKAWRADWTLWCAFCDAKGVPSLPAGVELLHAYLNERIIGAFPDDGRPPVGETRDDPPVPAYVRRATLERSLATIRKAHHIAGLPFPGETLEGQLTIRGQLRRLTKRQVQKRGLTFNTLQTILDEVPDDGALVSLRDRAVIWMAYSAMARRSELVDLRFNAITPLPNGGATVLLADAKTDQEGQGVLLYLREEALAAIRAWQAASGLTAGPILRALQDPGGRGRGEASPALRQPLREDWVPAGAAPGLRYRMTDHNVARIFKRYAERAGLDPSVYSGHSARVGAAQDMAENGFSVAQIMQAGRWKSERQLMRYIEHLEIGRGAAATLAERQRNQTRT